MLYLKPVSNCISLSGWGRQCRSRKGRGYSSGGRGNEAARGRHPSRHPRPPQDKGHGGRQDFIPKRT